MASFETYEDKTEKWRWRLISDNGGVVASSNESFDSKYNAERAARRVKELATVATVPPPVRVRLPFPGRHPRRAPAADALAAALRQSFGENRGA